MDKSKGFQILGARSGPGPEMRDPHSIYLKTLLQACLFYESFLLLV